MDHETLEEFVRALARATVYNSRDTGYVIVEYWRDEAQSWAEKLDEEKKNAQ
jgi:hypothetical protein